MDEMSGLIMSKFNPGFFCLGQFCRIGIRLDPEYLRHSFERVCEFKNVRHFCGGENNYIINAVGLTSPWVTPTCFETSLRVISHIYSVAALLTAEQIK